MVDTIAMVIYYNYCNNVFSCTYTDGPDADSIMRFSLISTATPPVFSLSFNVSDGPPTTVSCTVDGNGISTELSRVIVNGLRFTTRVAVTVRQREDGIYQCTVSNARVIAGTIGSVTAVSSTSSLSIGSKYIFIMYNNQNSSFSIRYSNWF